MRYSSAFFSDNEIACKCCGRRDLDDLFDLKLTELRVGFGEPMLVNSCCRCLKHNAEVGGTAKSFHICDKPAWKAMDGCGAIDIGYNKIFYRNKLARLAWKEGWRIGLNKNFLHIDIAAMKGIKPQTVFKYDNITDSELEKFKSILEG